MLNRAIDDKYSRREEYRGFTQEFKEKDGYRPDVKIEYVDETGRKLCPKEVSFTPTFLLVFKQTHFTISVLFFFCHRLLDSFLIGSMAKVQAK